MQLPVIGPSGRPPGGGLAYRNALAGNVVGVGNLGSNVVAALIMTDEGVQVCPIHLDQLPDGSETVATGVDGGVVFWGFPAELASTTVATLPWDETCLWLDVVQRPDSFDVVIERAGGGFRLVKFGALNTGPSVVVHEFPEYEFYPRREPMLRNTDLGIYTTDGSYMVPLPNGGLGVFRRFSTDGVSFDRIHLDGSVHQHEVITSTLPTWTNHWEGGFVAWAAGREFSLISAAMDMADQTHAYVKSGGMVRKVNLSTGAIVGGIAAPPETVRRFSYSTFPTRVEGRLAIANGVITIAANGIIYVWRAPFPSNGSAYDSGARWETAMIVGLGGVEEWTGTELSGSVNGINYMQSPANWSPSGGALVLRQAWAYDLT